MLESGPAEKQRYWGGNLTSINLIAWAMQAEPGIWSEIEHACRWPGPLNWNNLTEQGADRS